MLCKIYNVYYIGYLYLIFLFTIKKASLVITFYKRDLYEDI